MSLRPVLALLLAWATPVFAGDAPFLWRVDGPQATHYLLGSMHMLPQSAYPLPAAVEAAYDARAWGLLPHFGPA